MNQITHAVTIRGPAGSVTIRGVYDDDRWRVTLPASADVADGHELEIKGQRFDVAHVERWPDHVELKLRPLHDGSTVHP